MTTNNNDDDVIECISINGVMIDLRDVSHSLRQQYHAASRKVGRSDNVPAIISRPFANGFWPNRRRLSLRKRSAMPTNALA